MSYLWMIGLVMRLFSCGANLWRSSASIESKKVQPLEFYFWHVRLGLLKSPFLVGEAEHMWLYPFCKDKCIFSKKTSVLQFGRVDTKFLNSSHHVLSVDDWPGDAIFFLWANHWRLSRKYSVKKGPAPWILFLTRAPRPLEVTFFGWWSWTYVVVPLLQGQMYFQQKNVCFAIWARWHKILEFVPSCPICGWLAWRCDFFPVGQPLKIIPQVFSQKKEQPLGFYFWHVRLGLLKSPFLVGEAEHMWLYPFCKDKCIFSKKTSVLQFGRVDTKFLNSSHHVLSVDDWPGDAIFFLWANHWRLSRKYSVRKRSSPLDFIFDTCASASSSHFFGWWSWTCVSVPFCKDNCIFSKKNMCFAIWARVDTKFLNSSHHVLSVDDWPGDATFFLWGQPLKIIRKYSVKKGPAPWILFLTPASWPLEVTFLVGEGEHMCLYPFAKSCKESYPLN